MQKKNVNNTEKVQKQDTFTQATDKKLVVKSKQEKQGLKWQGQEWLHGLTKIKNKEVQSIWITPLILYR